MRSKARKLHFVLFSVIAVTASIGTAQAATRVVCPTMVSGCYSTKIQTAIDASAAGDIVTVKSGTYYENILVDKVITINSEKGASTTIIDGRNKTRAVPNNDSVVEIIAGATLNGFTLNNGIGKLENSMRFGGGIYVLDASPAIKNCVISYNSGQGGGIFVSGMTASPSISNCVIRYNVTGSETPDGRFGGGGGISIAQAGNSTITDCVISDNHAGYGGGLYLGGTAATIVRSTISGNTANGWNNHGGGGIYAVAAVVTMTNCVVSNNTAFGYNLEGGGLYFYYASPIMTNCTVANNASSGVGGVAMLGVGSIGGGPYGGGTGVITNSIIMDGFGYGSVPVTISFSDIQGGPAGTNGNIDADPQFVSNTDYRLAAGSPCVDTGTNSGAPVNDRDGNPRPQNGLTDMGAFEYGSESTKITITRGLYDYLLDKLDVSASTTLSLGSSKLYCNGYLMSLKSGVWSVSIPNLIKAPERITVCAPGVNPVHCRSLE